MDTKPTKPTKPTMEKIKEVIVKIKEESDRPIYIKKKIRAYLKDFTFTDKDKDEIMLYTGNETDAGYYFDLFEGYEYKCPGQKEYEKVSEVEKIFWERDIINIDGRRLYTYIKMNQANRELKKSNGLKETEFEIYKGNPDESGEVFIKESRGNQREHEYVWVKQKPPDFHITVKSTVTFGKSRKSRKSRPIKKRKSRK